MANESFSQILHMAVNACNANFYTGTRDIRETVLECATQIYIAQMGKDVIETENIKTEAIKEFKDRVIEKKHSQPLSQAEYYFGLSKEKSVVDVDDIEKTYEEMVGEDK